MNKKLFVILGIVAAFLIIGYVIMTFFLGSIVKSAVNSFGPKMTQTKVELASANISPLSGSGSLSGLFVGNPTGWSSDKAFYLGKTDIKLEPFSIFKDHIVINEIIVEQPEFVYETKIVTSNIKELLANIEKFTGGAADTNEPTTKDGKPIKFVIHKLRLTGAKATLGAGPTAITLPLPDIVMNDVGVKEGGITPGQFTIRVMQNVLTNIVTASAGAVLKSGATTGAGAVEAIKGLFGGSKSEPEKPVKEEPAKN